MIDADVMQDRIRDANPIPTLDALDADELAYFVAATHTRRAAAMQGPTQHPTETATPPTAPPPRRRSFWAFAVAFVLILVVVGAAALFLGGDDPQVTDEPVTVPPTVESVVTTTVASIDQVPVEGGVVPAGEWRVVVESEPWVKHIVDVEPLPGGGYVAVASRPSPWSVIWSPDGIAWRDGDPYEQVPAQTKRVGVGFEGFEWMSRSPTFSHLVAVTEGGVVILDQLNTGILVGDPQTGEWSPVSLDTRGLDGVPVPLAIAENGSRVLVVHAVENGSVAELVFWLVDPATKASLGPFTSGIEMRYDLPQVGWVGDRWLVMMYVWEPELDDMRNSLWASPDAETWTEVALPGGDSTGEDDTHGPDIWLGSLTTAPPGALVSRGWMSGGDAWYSPDGIEWQRVREVPINGAVYSDTYGFVISPDDTTLLASDDGVAWHHLEGDHWARLRYRRGTLGALLAASGRTVLQQLDLAATINDPILGGVSNLVLWSEDSFPSTPTTTVPSARAVTTPTLPPVSGPRIEMTEDEYSAFMNTFFYEWADGWISGDAARISSMFSDDAVYVTFGDGVEHHGRAEIEAALAAHFKRASYSMLDLLGYDHFPPLLDTPDGPVLDVTYHWTWGGTLDDDSYDAVPAMTRFQINYADSTVLGCIQRIEWRGGGYQEIGPATGS